MTVLLISGAQGDESKDGVSVRVRKKSAGLAQLVFCLLALLLASCGSNKQQVNTSGGDGSFPRTVRTADGAETTVRRKPERIVSLTPSNDEILCALVEERRIVGLSKYSQDEATSHVADVARRINVVIDRNAEQIIALQPDLVLASRSTRIDLTGLLAQTSLAVVKTSDFRSFAEIEANIRLIGRTVGEEVKAESVIGEMRQKLSAARVRLRPEREGLRVLYLAPGNFTAGSETTIGEILSAAGLRNAAAEAGIRGHVKIAPEQITEINPDVILTGTGYERDQGFRQRLETDAQLSSVKAIKEKRIIELPARDVLTVSQYVADAVAALVEAVNQLPAN
jgi:iron complex transport system substrate-binding protein